MTRQLCPVPSAGTLERDDIRISPAYLPPTAAGASAAGYDPRLLLALTIVAGPPYERHPAAPQCRRRTPNPRRYSSDTILQSPGGE